MVSKQTATIIVAVIGLLGAVGGGSLMLDFSSTETTTTDNSQTTTINEGDTIINEAVDTFTGEMFEDFVDMGYDYYCEEVEPDSPDCDEYFFGP